MRSLEKVVQIAAIAEAAVVIVSAFLIVAQLRSQSRALDSQTAISASQLGVQRIYELQSNQEFDHVVQLGFSNYKALSPFDQQRFKRYVLMNLFIGEDFFVQHANGQMSDATWENWARGLARYRGELDEPQWKAWKQYFSKDYAKFLTNLKPQPYAGF